MENHPDVAAFLSYLKFVHTLEAYRRDLEQFCGFMEEQYPGTSLLSATSLEIRTWMVQLMEDQITARSIGRKVSALRAFYRYHSKQAHLSVNPMEAIVAPKIAKRLPQFVEAADMDRLFRDELFEDTFEGHRDRLIMELFYVTGMRLSELVGLRKCDVNLYDCQLKVLGKRNKERIIPFSPRVKGLIENYLNEFEEKYPSVSEKSFIFVAPNGNKIYAKAVYRIVRKYLDMVTTIDKRSPHVLRHTFATQMLNNGADINAIKEILGHSSLAATQVYTHNSIEKLKNIYNQAHPRA